MDRVKKLKLNSIFSLISKVVILFSGLILPKLILDNYGSETNGLVASITQFLGVITFLDLGVGSVVQSALYKPLAKKNSLEVSAVLTAAQKYFRRIAYILIVYIAILILAFPMIVSTQSLNWISTTMLIIAISINLFGQYYFGIVNELLLNADQKAYIQLITEIIVVILNLLASIILINLNFPIYIVKLVSGLIYLIRPLYLNYYVKNNYNISKNITLGTDPLPQKWNGMGQHIAYSIQNSTDIIVLTTFSTLENVSVYSVYSMVANAIKLLIQSLVTGLQSFFGGLIAEQKYKELNSYFNRIEWIVHTSVVFSFGVASVLISPFVMIYTQGTNDANYYAPTFAALLLLSRAAYSIRIPYQNLVFAAGHYKQTQLSSIIEAILNVILSVLLVNFYGLKGVAIGSLIAMVYRTSSLARYLSNNIINRPISLFNKQIIIDLVTFFIIIAIGNILILRFQIESLFVWIVIAMGVSIVSLVLIIIINFIFYRNMLKYIIKKIFKKAK